jgi:flagellar biosynthesis/type III secretory pathway protein FliH
VIREARAEDDVFLLGQAGPGVASPGPVSSAAEIVAAAGLQAERLLAAARQEAARITGVAARAAEEALAAARQEGLAAGRVEAREEAAAALAILRAAAEAGKEVRDKVATQSGMVVARAVALASRRLVADHYESDPSRTAAVCAEALRSAAGQEVLSVRVHPRVAGLVQAALGEAGEYVRPDDAVEIGGCIVDLRHGSIDATLDARLSLMRLALAEAAGESLP